MAPSTFVTMAAPEAIAMTFLAGWVVCGDDDAGRCAALRCAALMQNCPANPYVIVGYPGPGKGLFTEDVTGRTAPIKIVSGPKRVGL